MACCGLLAAALDFACSGCVGNPDGFHVRYERVFYVSMFFCAVDLHVHGGIVRPVIQGPFTNTRNVVCNAKFEIDIDIFPGNFCCKNGQKHIDINPEFKDCY